jgi:hypothetical protein
MEVNKADENSERDDVLQNEHFVVPAADGCHGAEDDPN